MFMSQNRWLMLMAPVFCVSLDSKVEDWAVITVLTEGTDGWASFLKFHTRIVQWLMLGITCDLWFGLLDNNHIMLMKNRVDLVSNNMIIGVQKQLTLIHPPKCVSGCTYQPVAVPHHGPLLLQSLTPLILGDELVQLQGARTVQVDAHCQTSSLALCSH